MSSFLKLVTGSNKYAGKEMIQSLQLENQNERFSKMLKRNNIDTVNMTSLGNSIATGYSMNSVIKPLLKRNENLESLLNSSGININTYSFARAQDNNDEHVLDWILNNIKQSEINRRVHVDFGDGPNAMDRSCIIDENVEKYYPLNPVNDIGLNDLIMKNKENEANIIVYNGATGSFLDNFTRKGRHLNFHGFYRDFKSMEAVLKTIYLKNPDTQVYVCGIPTFTELNLTFYFNNKIKKICENYPNCTYVAPAPQHMIYDKNGNLSIDIHYNEHEYLKLNNNIMKSIVDNYERNRCLIDFDKTTKAISNTCQYDEPDKKNTKKYMWENINNLIVKHRNVIDKEMLKTIIEYYQEKYPYDYFYTPKEKVEKILDRKIRKLK